MKHDITNRSYIFATKNECEQIAKQRNLKNDEYEIVQRDDKTFMLRDFTSSLFDASKREKSKCERPCDVVRQTMKQNKNASRAFVRSLCIKQGVHTGTFNVQYARFKKMMNDK